MNVLQEWRSAPRRYRRDDEATLRAAGITGPAAEFMLTLTARARHDGRCGEIVRAFDALWAEGWEHSADLRASAILELILDVFGSGCAMPFGRASARLGLMAQMGSGRSHAHDGGAWDAARDTVIAHLVAWGAPPAEADVCTVIAGKDEFLLHLRTGAGGTADITQEATPEWVDLCERVAVLAMRCLTGHAAPHWGWRDAPQTIALTQSVRLEIDGQAGDWARVYNAAHESRMRRTVEV